MRVDLSQFTVGSFNRGASKPKEALWVVINCLLFQLCPVSASRIKCAVLRLFGAKVGKGVVIKPEVKITFPWKLTLGNHVWLGEQCWLLNLASVQIDSNVCISQRAFLCTGNHDYSGPRFDLITNPIRIEEGAWVGAGAFVGPGITLGSHAVLAAGSVATKDLEPWTVYRGNPATPVRRRSFKQN